MSKPDEAPDPLFSGDDWFEKWLAQPVETNGELPKIPYDPDWWAEWQKKMNDVPLW